MTEGSEAQLADREVADAVKILKALGHPIRLRILDVLANKSAFGFEDESCCGQAEVCVCKINKLFDVSMPTISHHLKLLREAGLVTTRRDGVWIYYSLRREPLARVAGMLGDLAARGA
ncbi:MAG: ArsR/SmtB family transcription factor [Thermoleophilia bacterium]